VCCVLCVVSSSVGGKYNANEISRQGVSSRMSGESAVDGIKGLKSMAFHMYDNVR